MTDHALRAEVMRFRRTNTSYRDIGIRLGISTEEAKAIGHAAGDKSARPVAKTPAPVAWRGSTLPLPVGSDVTWEALRLPSEGGRTEW